jgi:hypothetical protein
MKMRTLHPDVVAELEAASGAGPPAAMCSDVDFWTEVGAVLREHVAAATKPLRDKIAELETSNQRLAAQVAALQAAGIRYVGAYQRAQTYKRGDICTMDGSMWCAISDVSPNEQPGRSQVWQLCCRAGRDGKDARGVA